MKNYLFILGLCYIFAFSLQSCKDEKTPCCDGYNLNVITHWIALEEGRSKPSTMSALVYSPESPDYLRTSLHPDGGSLYSEFEYNHLLLYNIQEGKGVTFQSLNDYTNAEAPLIPYEEENEIFIPEPYLLYGESFSHQKFSETSASLHYSPVALTHLIRFEIVTIDAGVENIVACQGKLSGLSSGVNLSTKQMNEKGYPVKFKAIRTTTNYLKELYHFGYVDNNVLELSFEFENGESKEGILDMTEMLSAIARQNLTCRLTVIFNESGVSLEIKDVVIEPYKIGSTDSIDIS
ncbi:MAG: DUF5119 domain-containing protein [Clostridium sp.]|nr:DUF5119 domain-containing protein [Clostridium sp.]